MTFLDFLSLERKGTDVQSKVLNKSTNSEPEQSDFTSETPRYFIPNEPENGEGNEDDQGNDGDNNGSDEDEEN